MTANVGTSVGVVLKRNVEISLVAYHDPARPAIAPSTMGRAASVIIVRITSRGRTERHAHTNLLCSARHGVGRHAEHTDERQQQAQSAEQAQQDGPALRRDDGVVEPVAPLTDALDDVREDRR